MHLIGSGMLCKTAALHLSKLAAYRWAQGEAARERAMRRYNDAVRRGDTAAQKKWSRIEHKLGYERKRVINQRRYGLDSDPHDWTASGYVPPKPKGSVGRVINRPVKEAPMPERTPPVRPRPEPVRPTPTPTPTPTKPTVSPKNGEGAFSALKNLSRRGKIGLGLGAAGLIGLGGLAHHLMSGGQQQQQQQPMPANVGYVQQ